MFLEDAETSTPKRRASTSPMPSSSPDEDMKPKIKQEHMDTSGSPEDTKKSRTEVADAESNTMHSGKFIIIQIFSTTILSYLSRTSRRLAIQCKYYVDTKN